MIVGTYLCPKIRFGVFEGDFLVRHDCEQSMVYSQEVGDADRRASGAIRQNVDPQYGNARSRDRERKSHAKVRWVDTLPHSFIRDVHRRPHNVELTAVVYGRII